MRQFGYCRKAAVAFLVCAATAIAGNHPAFTILTTFPTPVFPGYPPVQGTDGNFYGTTGVAYPTQGGTIYKITPAGVLPTIYSFCSQPNCTDGAGPTGGLLLGTDGNFYGTTSLGGASNRGTVFQITPSGALTTLHSFDQTDGALPCVTLIQANSGDFYGLTPNGGTNGAGTIFKITAAGALTTLYDFTGLFGAYLCASLLQAANGNFYGTISDDSLGNGSIFELTLAGTFSTVHTFNSTDGANPQDGLVQTADGSFYGTTARGGANGVGTVFKLAPDGTLTTLYSFGSLPSPNGSYPYAPLVYASNGKFYGTATIGGGPGHIGAIFEITSNGKLTKLYSFTSTDGQPYYGLLQGTDGAFYGTAVHGGVGGGIVYKLSAGLPPFLKPVPPSGAVGSAVMILGTNLTGTTSVTFNGSAAAFTVVSPTGITATVPAGATTGKIQAITPTGTLSNVGRFIVTK